MSQRHSEYELLPGDCYYTPTWVTEALLSVEVFPNEIWEPACGDGHMARVLSEYANRVAIEATDLPNDFLMFDRIPDYVESIITNPPYSHGLAEKFVRHALDLTEPVKGKVAMLLPLAWDSAKGRRDIFAGHPAFKAKYTLTHRIRWANLEQKKAGPSQNHAWYVWDWNNAGSPICGYLTNG